MPNPIPLEEQQQWLKERADWLRDLPPSPYPDFLTGILLRHPDPRDWDARDHLPAAAPPEAPASADIISKLQGPPLNQGAEPSCVSHTAAGDQSIFQWDEERVWRVFDAHRIHRETGPIDQGRYPDQVLQYGVQRGFPIVNGEQRYKLTGYAFVQRENWAETIKACIAGGKAVWICYLIPSTYGWDSNDSPTQGYHETVFVGYDPTWLIFRNSWGNWGNGGLGRVRWSYLMASNFQNGYCQAHIPVDEGGAPLPPVGKSLLVSGRYKVAGAETIAAGQHLTLAGLPGDFEVLTVKAEDTTPPPNTLALTAYDPNPAKPGTPVRVQGAGFTAATRITLNGDPAPQTQYFSATQMQIEAPVVATTTVYRVAASDAGRMANGPDLVVSTGSGPTPGELSVTLYGLGPQLRAVATLGAQPAHCRFTGDLSGTPLPEKQSTSMLPYAAVWTDANPGGKLATVTATTLDGLHTATTSRQF